jgi:uncharacterized membrane protein YccC
MTTGFGFREIIFSLNCFIAAMLALFIAFSLDFKTPAWAMTTVYLTSQPLSGAVRARALYRVVGTLIGAVAMVAIVPNLVNAPELTALAIAVWVGLCLYVSLLDRRPRAYTFVLAGYTAALIGFPSVLNPEAVFDTAIARAEEIVLGTLCAAAVHSLIFPRSVTSVLRAKLSVVLVEARRWIAEGLTQQSTPAGESHRRQFSVDVTEMSIMSANLAYDTTPQRPHMNMVRALDERLVALLPLLDAVEDRIGLLQRYGLLGKHHANLLSDIASWISGDQTVDRPRALELRQACLSAAPQTGPDSGWLDIVTTNLALRLIELIDSWQECLELVALIRDPSLRPDGHIRAALTRRGMRPLHRDGGIAALSALAAAVAMLTCCTFWIATAWPDGASAATFAGAMCVLYAAFDDPTPKILGTMLGFAACLPLVTIYQFAILPAIDGFILLAVVLTPVLIPVGIALAMPRYMSIGLSVAFGFGVELGLQSSYNADLATVLNSNSALLVGIWVGLVTTRLMRVVSVELSARRLVRAGLRDLADIAEARTPTSRADWASRMLDRVGLLLPRLAASRSHPELEFAAALRDLRTGVSVIELQELKSDLSRPARERIGAMLREAASYFRSLAPGRRRAPGPALLRYIDAVIVDILALEGASRRQSGLAAIVGLRRTLYPEAPRYASTSAADALRGLAAAVHTSGETAT